MFKIDAGDHWIELCEEAATEEGVRILLRYPYIPAVEITVRREQ